MATASGVEKKVILAPQAAKGTCAVANVGTAQYLRRVTSSMNLTKETYQSNEMRADRQIADFRHGVQSVEGSISGELSPGTYEKFMAAILRKEWVAAPASGAPDPACDAAECRRPCCPAAYESLAFWSAAHQFAAVRIFVNTALGDRAPLANVAARS